MSKTAFDSRQSRAWQFIWCRSGNPFVRAQKNEFNPANVNISSQSQTHLETKQVLPSFSTVSRDLFCAMAVALPYGMQRARGLAALSTFPYKM
jgi:hypothetical protein